MKRQDNKSLLTINSYVSRKRKSRLRWLSSRDLSKRLDRKLTDKLKQRKQLPLKQGLRLIENKKL